MFYFVGPEKSISWVLTLWPVLVGACLASLAATWLCKKIAIQFDIVDKPDNFVKTHKKPVAYLGGVGILIGVTVGVLAGINCLKLNPVFGQCMKMLFGILAGATVACFVGLVDDLFDIKPRQKILGQMLAAFAIILVGILPNISACLDLFSITINGHLLLTIEIIVTVAFVLGATNSLNLLDGLDGLCGGVTAIITLAMLFLSLHLASWEFSPVGDPVRIIICLALVGAIAGFLPFNRHPAKIFMGDAGSMLLGFLVATLMVLFGEKIPRWWMASIVVFGLPILDTAVAMVRRFINRKPIFVSDRGHLYDQLIDRGMSLKQSIRTCYLIAGLYAFIGLAMSQLRTRYAAVIYVIVIVISALIVWKKGFLKILKCSN